MIELPYEGIEPSTLISIERLYSVHYFEYAKDFVFEGERHDFWEFVCVDRGEVTVAAGDRRLLLHKDQIAFHEPGEFHDVRATRHSAPDLMVIAFSCRDPAMSCFRGKVLSLDDGEKRLLGAILGEARRAFSHRLDDPYAYQPVRSEPEDPGAEQLLTAYLTVFLLHLMRRTGGGAAEQKREGAAERLTSAHDLEMKYLRVRRYFEKHIGQMLTVEEICADSLMSRAQLFRIFRKKEACGPIEAFSRMKIERAKVLIRQSDDQFSQIAVRLGFSSLAYFSRTFKKLTGMSPSEYSRSIKALSERGREK